MRMFLIVALALSAGCQTYRGRMWHYPNLGFNVVKARPEVVKRVCMDGGPDDEGNPVTSPPRCCFVPSTRTIWIDAYESRDGDCLLHELCHADGIEDIVCSKVHWNDERDAGGLTKEGKPKVRR